MAYGNAEVNHLAHLSREDQAAARVDLQHQLYEVDAELARTPPPRWPWVATLLVCLSGPLAAALLLGITPLGNLYLAQRIQQTQASSTVTVEEGNEYLVFLAHDPSAASTQCSSSDGHMRGSFAPDPLLHVGDQWFSQVGDMSPEHSGDITFECRTSERPRVVQEDGLQPVVIETQLLSVLPALQVGALVLAALPAVAGLIRIYGYFRHRRYISELDLIRTRINWILQGKVPS
ncbi:hypothetical protein [Kocuria sp. ZOR0020]|uniref:hypothetical protein n=1 Tax=Kocuria sp. ZOR0020 TaxID=1339234 RepID=UPI00064585E5|nr:hypothetical protein [Kocuria sp. ZOR0020]